MNTGQINSITGRINWSTSRTKENKMESFEQELEFKNIKNGSKMFVENWELRQLTHFGN